MIYGLNVLSTFLSFIKYIVFPIGIMGFNLRKSKLRYAIIPILGLTAAYLFNVNKPTVTAEVIFQIVILFFYVIKHISRKHFVSLQRYKIKEKM